jgi:geranylgeranyl reductase family protein
MRIEEAEVVVVGAGPGGCATAYHLARRGVSVALLERSTFPRQKVCGDGLTPRAVRHLLDMGVDPVSSGWTRTSGLRFRDGDRQVTLPWPVTARFPGYGLTRTPYDLDALLADRAVAAGARLLTSTTVTGPLLEPDGRACGVTAQADGAVLALRAPVVIAASGVSARLPTALGVHRHPGRPVGVAVRRYFRTPPGYDDRYLDIVLGLRHLADDRTPLPGYGWIFGLGDGRVNVGLAVHDSGGRLRHGDHRALMTRWLRSTPPEWGLADERNAEGAVQGAALPMGFNRVPHYHRGVLLVGDCGGMVNPFTGEGIAYALESGELAAQVAARALDERAGPARERVLHGYGEELDARHGGHYRVGRRFVGLVDDPRMLDLGLRHVPPRPRAMGTVLRLMTRLTDPVNRPTDRLIELASTLARPGPRRRPGR